MKLCPEVMVPDLHGGVVAVQAEGERVVEGWEVPVLELALVGSASARTAVPECHIRRGRPVTV